MPKKKRKMPKPNICLVCSTSIKLNEKQKVRPEERKEIFDSLCLFLNIGVDPSLYWDLKKENLPFCVSCITPAIELADLHKEMESIYAKMFAVARSIMVQVSRLIPESASDKSVEKYLRKKTKTSIGNEKRVELFRKKILVEFRRLEAELSDDGIGEISNEGNPPTATNSDENSKDIESESAKRSATNRTVKSKNFEPDSNVNVEHSFIFQENKEVSVPAAMQVANPSCWPQQSAEQESETIINDLLDIVKTENLYPDSDLEIQQTQSLCEVNKEDSEPTSPMDVDVDYLPDAEFDSDSSEYSGKINGKASSDCSKQTEILTRNLEDKTEFIHTPTEDDPNHKSSASELNDKNSAEADNRVERTYDRIRRRGSKCVPKFKPLSLLRTAPKKKVVFHYLTPDGTIEYEGIKIIAVKDGFECDLCHKVFGYRNSIFNHIAMIHTDGKNCCTCEICGKKFRTPSQVQKHKEGHGKRKSYLMDQFKCAICDLRFIKQSDLDVHTETVHNEGRISSSNFREKSASFNISERSIPSVSGNSNVIMPKANRKTSITIQKNDQGKLFWSGVEVLQIDGKYKCSLCDDVYKYQHAIVRYIVATHLDQSHWHPCPVCQKKFRQPYEVKQHLQIHENKRSYKCIVCSRGFNLKQTLYCHLRTHSKEQVDQANEKCGNQDKVRTRRARPTEKSLDPNNKGKDCYRDIEVLTVEDGFQCGLCKDFTYKYRHGVTNHIVSQHIDKSEWYPCEVCGRLFRTVGEVKMHNQVHENKRTHKCDICGKGFNLRGLLTTHKKFHPEEREKQKHVCPICGKKFCSRQAQENHTRTHTGERPFHCPHPLCDRTFTQKATQVFHTKNVHAEDFEED